jgi:acetyl-CoA carboxylase carboxyltransferase component
VLTDDTIPEEIATVERLRELRDLVTTEMGGPDAVGAIHAAGRRTAREHIAELVDAGSFREIGTFATFTDKVTAEHPGTYWSGRSRGGIRTSACPRAPAA